MIGINRLTVFGLREDQMIECEACGSSCATFSVVLGESKHNVCGSCFEPQKSDLQDTIDRCRAYRLAIHGVLPDSVFPSKLTAGMIHTWYNAVHGVTAYDILEDTILRGSEYTARFSIPGYMSVGWFPAHAIDWAHYYATRYEGLGYTEIGAAVPEPVVPCSWCSKPATEGQNVCASGTCYHCMLHWTEQCKLDGYDPSRGPTDYDRAAIERRVERQLKIAAPITCSDRAQPSGLDKRIAVARYELDPHGLAWSTPCSES